MNQLKIYCAGIMDAVHDTPEVMTGWRNQTKDYFSLHNVKVLDPCRRPHSNQCTLSDKEILELDLNDVRESDLLLVDCRDHGKPQFGTPVEVFYANYILKKPVIGWYDDKMGYRKNSVFQNVLVTNMFPSLDEALDHISRFYVGQK